MNKLAQDPILLSPKGEGFTLPGWLGQNPAVDAPGRLSTIISTLIGVITIIAFIWFVIQFFIAAVQIIGSGGDKAALASARSKLATSVVGVVVVIAAIFFIEIVGTIFGIEILNLPKLINDIMP
jgi:hypothetical protein